MTERGILRLRSELENESNRNQKLQSHLEGRLRKMQNSLENVNKKILNLVNKYVLSDLLKLEMVLDFRIS